MASKYLNIGGGRFHQKDWLNLDYPFDKYAGKRDINSIDIKHNLMLMKKIPLENNSMEIVYSEHTIEHLSYKAAQFMLNESYRILCHSGIIRIACPDAEVIYDFYKNDRQELLITGKFDKNQSIECNMVDKLCSYLNIYYDSEEIKRKFKSMPKKDFIDLFCCYEHLDPNMQEKNPGAHVSCWTFDKLKHCMEKAGFRKIKQKQQRASKHDELTKSFIDTTAPLITLYIEGYK